MIGRLRAGALFLLVAAAACEGSGTSVGGTVFGTSYQMKDAMVVYQSTGAVLLFTNDDNLCAEGNSNAIIKDVQLTEVELGILAPSGDVVPPDVAGDYPIETAFPDAGSKLSRAESTVVGICEFGAVFISTAGSVTLSHVEVNPSGNPVRLVGTADLSFSDGGTLTGPFDASLCPGSFDLRVLFCSE